MNKEKAEYDLSIVVPVYKNQEHLNALYDAIKTSLQSNKITFEIILVNDCSPDNSWDVITELSDAYSGIKTVNLIKNVGQHWAIMSGFQYCHGRNIMVLDADLQDDPAVIPAIYQLLKDKVDCVFVKRNGVYQSRIRMVGSQLFKTVLNMFTGLPKECGTFFMIRHDLKDKILCADFQYFHTPTAVYCFCNQAKFVGAKRKKRNSGNSAYGFFKRMNQAYIAIQCARECKKKVRKT